MMVALACRSVAWTSPGSPDKSGLTSPLYGAMDRQHLRAHGWRFGSFDQCREPWDRGGKGAPPQRMRLDAGQELGPHQETGAGQGARP
jgi:hypothetical protein